MSEVPTVAPEAAPAEPNLITTVDGSKPEAASPEPGAVENKPGEEPGETQEQPEKPRSKASERIDELYGRMKVALRERDAAIAEVQRLRQPVADPAQWDQMSYEEQQAAQVRQAVRHERAEEVARAAEIRAQEADRVRQDMFVQRLESVREAIPDIDKALADPSLPVSPIGARLITESDVGPQVAYWLSQNRQEAARIASLDPYSQAFEMGRIEQRITAAPVARKVSNAPAPVPKVGGGSGAGAKDPASMSMSEYIEWSKTWRR